MVKAQKQQNYFPEIMPKVNKSNHTLRMIHTKTIVDIQPMMILNRNFDKRGDK